MLAAALGLQGGTRAEFIRAGRDGYWRGRTVPAGGDGPESGADRPPAGRVDPDPRVDPRSEPQGHGGGRSTPAAAPVSAAIRVRPRAAPAQLPPDTPDFTGRDGELRWLDGRLAVAERADASPDGPDKADEAAAARAGVAISLLSGPPGVGKTALAVRWAHRVQDRFPDGQLYVNLRGYDPELPVSPAAALAWFLSALGVSSEDVPVELDSRAARYRTEMAGRRMLVLLDNAASVEQVRPLLPGSRSCVVVTSRDSLAGLVALHGARRLDLDLLPSGDAIVLLHRLIGERLAAEPAVAAALATYCCQLPLAIRVAAELVSMRPTTPLADQVAELADQRRRLELLEAGGDQRAAVRSVFSWSYRHLPPDTARIFRLVGLHPGADFDLYAAAALADASLTDGRRLVDLLTRAHLIHPARAGRYGMHDLLRAYAAHLAGIEDSDADRRAALTRLFDYYLATSAAAMDILYAAERHLRPSVQRPDLPIPVVTDPGVARAWLDVERLTLAAVCAHTSTHGRPTYTIRLAATLHRHLDSTSRYPDALTIHTHAHHAAVQAHDRAAEAHTLTNLGVTYWRLGRYDLAADHHRRALVLFGELGDHDGEAQTLVNLGGVHWRLGRYDTAADCVQRALVRYRESGDRHGEARALTSLGLIHRRLRRYESATDCARQALVLSRELGHRVGEAFALNSLGVIYTQLGQYRPAADCLHEALALFCELGDRAGEAEALTNMGTLDVRQRDYPSAADHQQRALALLRETGYRHGEASALNGLGEALRAAGRLAEALGQHATALAVAAETGERDEQARAHNGLAHVHSATGDLARARQHWQDALILYTDLGTPDAADVRAQLTHSAATLRRAETH